LSDDSTTKPINSLRDTVDESGATDGAETVDDGVAETVSVTTSVPGHERPKTEAPDRGESIDRFLVLDTLGEGGMGVVVSAYDPRLDRRVAIKLLHARAAEPGHTEAARARLVREARAMGKLRHPNVLTVYEVGTFLDQVFVAMEHVNGGTLREHVESHPAMAWQDIVALYVKAGRGLAAAHAAGMVHRDFKPENVLIEGDRVQVADFGIVGIDAPPRSPSKSERNDGADDSDLTRTGSVMGTPLYMSPEQHRGEHADARADQYAFCVALYQALYKSHPFGRAQALDFVDRKLEGALEPPPRSKSVPGWVYETLKRGLSVSSSDRFESMDALLQVLEPKRDESMGRKTRRVVAIVVGTAFALPPTLGGEFGIPKPIEGSWDAAVLTLGLLVLLTVLTWFTRKVMLGSTYNRSIVSILYVVLFSDLLLAFATGSFGLGPRQDGILALCHWGLAAWAFALIVERRMIPTAIGYTVTAIIAILNPDLVFYMMSTGSLILVINAAYLWRERTQPAAAAVTSEPTAHTARTVKLKKTN
jgi:hypothetical protein